jgi:hypothetical protein
VATRPLNAAQVFAASPSLVAPQVQMASYAATFASAHAIASRSLPTEAELHSDANADLRRLGKGVGWALGIEGVTALCAYAVWFLCHLWL